MPNVLCIQTDYILFSYIYISLYILKLYSFGQEKNTFDPKKSKLKLIGKFK